MWRLICLKVCYLFFRERSLRVDRIQKCATSPASSLDRENRRRLTPHGSIVSEGRLARGPDARPEAASEFAEAHDAAPVPVPAHSRRERRPHARRGSSPRDAGPDREGGLYDADARRGSQGLPASRQAPATNLRRQSEEPRETRDVVDASDAPEPFLERPGRSGGAPAAPGPLATEFVMPPSSLC